MQTDVVLAALQRKHELEQVSRMEKISNLPRDLAEAQAGVFLEIDYDRGRHWIHRIVRSGVPMAVAVDEEMERESLALCVGARLLAVMAAGAKLETAMTEEGMSAAQAHDLVAGALEKMYRSLGWGWRESSGGGSGSSWKWWRANLTLRRLEGADEAAAAAADAGKPEVGQKLYASYNTLQKMLYAGSNTPLCWFVGRVDQKFWAWCDGEMFRLVQAAAFS